MRKTVTTTASVVTAFESFRSALQSIGVDTASWRLVNAVGSGFEVIGATDPRFPSLLGNKENAHALLTLWSNAVSVTRDALSAQAEETPKEAPKGARKASA